MQNSMDFNSVWIFIKVVELGSYSRAARYLEIPVSTVSKRITALEKQLRVNLLRRTTRVLQLTEAGRAFNTQCLIGFAAIKSAEALATSVESEPRGRLRVTAPADIADTAFNYSVSQFLNQYSKVDLELILTNDLVDIVKNNVDLAIRKGPLKSNNLRALKIGTHRHRLFASSDYLQKSPPIHTPEDLRTHACLYYTAEPSESGWCLRAGRHRIRVPVKSRVMANNVFCLREMAMMGVGVAFLPAALVQKDIHEKRLVEVLPSWSFDDEIFYFVYQEQAHPQRNLRLFMEHMKEPLKTMLEI